MEINISDILPILRTAYNVTSKGRTGILPVYNSVRFSGHEVECFNGECGIIQKTAQNWDEISAAVPATILVSLLEKLAETYQVVRLTRTKAPNSEDTQSLTITSGSFSATIPVFPLKDYPKNNVEKEAEASLDFQGDLLLYLQAARFCAASDLAQSVLGSVALRDGRIYAVEAKRLYVGATDIPMPEGRTVVFPSALADLLIQVGQKPTKLALLEDKIVLYTPTCLIFGQRLAADDRYPKVDDKIEKVLNDEVLASITFDQKKLSNIVQRLLILNNTLTAAMELVVKPNEVVLKNAPSNDLKVASGISAEEALVCAVEAKEPCSLFIGGRSLLDAVEKFSTVDLFSKAFAFKNNNGTRHLVAALVP